MKYACEKCKLHKKIIVANFQARDQVEDIGVDDIKHQNRKIQ
jgi:hypothetical protein